MDEPRAFWVIYSLEHSFVRFLLSLPHDVRHLPRKAKEARKVYDSLSSTGEESVPITRPRRSRGRTVALATKGEARVKGRANKMNKT